MLLHASLWQWHVTLRRGLNFFGVRGISAAHREEKINCHLTQHTDHTAILGCINTKITPVRMRLCNGVRWRGLPLTLRVNFCCTYAFTKPPWNGACGFFSFRVDAAKIGRNLAYWNKYSYDISIALFSGLLLEQSLVSDGLSAGVSDL